MNTIDYRPGETREQFIRRVVDAAPSPTPELIARLATLLPLPAPTEGGADDG